MPITIATNMAGSAYGDIPKQNGVTQGLLGWRPFFECANPRLPGPMPNACRTPTGEDTQGRIVIGRVDLDKGLRRREQPRLLGLLEQRLQMRPNEVCDRASSGLVWMRTIALHQ
jgi:hypothetical protein